MIEKENETFEMGPANIVNKPIFFSPRLRTVREYVGELYGNCLINISVLTVAFALNFIASFFPQWNPPIINLLGFFGFILSFGVGLTLPMNQKIRELD